MIMSHFTIATPRWPYYCISYAIFAFFISCRWRSLLTAEAAVAFTPLTPPRYARPPFDIFAAITEAAAPYADTSCHAAAFRFRHATTAFIFSPPCRVSLTPGRLASITADIAAAVFRHAAMKLLSLIFIAIDVLSLIGSIRFRRRH